MAWRRTLGGFAASMTRCATTGEDGHGCQEADQFLLTRTPLSLPHSSCNTAPSGLDCCMGTKWFLSAIRKLSAQ